MPLRQTTDMKLVHKSEKGSTELLRRIRGPNVTSQLKTNLDLTRL